MTHAYRPSIGRMGQRPAAVAVLEPQADVCPVPTKRGDECMAYPTSNGICVGHQARAKKMGLI